MLNKAESNPRAAEDKKTTIRSALKLIDAYLVTATESYTALRTAEQNGDPNAITHHYTIIMLAHQRALDAAARARLAYGQSQQIGDQGLSEVTADPNIVPVDPILEGGYIDLDEIFGNVFDPVKLPPLTPFQ